MRLVGLTGGIATGKSTVSEILRRLGCVVIDADQLAREVVAPGEPALAAVVREFGDVLTPEGALDRKKVAAIVFVDPARRRRLEAILHPAIRARFDARLAALARDGFEGIVVFDAPVMIESGGYKNMDRLIVVATDEATQRARLVARDGDAAEGERRIASQMPLAEKVKLADYVIDNSGDHAATEARTRDVHAALTTEAALSHRLCDRACRISVLFPVGMGIYKQNRIEVAKACDALQSAGVPVVGFHRRASGNFVIRDNGPTETTAARSIAASVLRLPVVCRSFPGLYTLLSSWPADWRSPFQEVEGHLVKVGVMIDLQPDGAAPTFVGRLSTRVDAVRWVSSSDVLCAYMRPKKNGSLGHVSRAVLKRVRRKDSAADGTARSVSVIGDLLAGRISAAGREEGK